MSPLAMPGPDFLVFYWKSFAVALGLTFLLRWLCRRRFASGQSFAFMRRDLGATELAVISGKPHRLVELALARLARDGRLAVGADGKLECVGNLSPGAGEVEGQVYNALKGGSRTLDELRKAVEPPAATTALLEQRGLLAHPGSDFARALKMSSVPMFLVLALGGLKLVVGLVRDKPVGFLLVSLAVTGALAVLMLLARSTLTPSAKKVFEEFSTRYKALQISAARRSSDLSEADLSMAVALYGTVVLANSDLGWLSQHAVPRSEGGGGCGSGCSASGGGGDGGGSGCGGCGGGCS